MLISFSFFSLLVRIPITAVTNNILFKKKRNRRRHRKRMDTKSNKMAKLYQCSFTLANIWTFSSLLLLLNFFDFSFSHSLSLSLSRNLPHFSSGSRCSYTYAAWKWHIVHCVHFPSTEAVFSKEYEFNKEIMEKNSGDIQKVALSVRNFRAHIVINVTHRSFVH